MKKAYSLPAGRQGFTLVELLVYTAILVTFLYILTSIFTAILATQLESQTSSAVVSDRDYLFSRLAYDIGRASALAVPASLGAETSSLAIVINGVTYTYTLVNGDLLLTNNLGTSALNGFGTKLSNISFRRYGNVNGKPSVRIAFTLTSTTTRQSGPDVRDFQTTVGLR